MAAREVPAPRYGSVGSCRSFPEPAFPARAFLGMRSQGCWFGEPARMEGIWGKSVGPLLWLTPSPPALGSEAAPGMGPSRLALHLLPQQREPQPQHPPVRVYREMKLLQVSGGKRKGGKKFPASARQQEPSLSLANLRPIPHGLSGLCVC